jgi:Ca-activated chloride channel homolog
MFTSAAFGPHAGVAARQNNQVGKSSAEPSPPPQKQQEQTAQQQKTPAPDTPTTAPVPTGPQVQVGDDDERNPVITHTDLVTMTVTVTDTYGRFVTGLNKNAFTVTDDKDPQEITFFSDDDAPVSVGVVFDLTGSMSGEKVGRAREALAHFLETSHNDDEYFLVTFQSGRVFLTLDRTRDSKAVLDKLTFVQTKGSTAFYDAVYLAATKVQRGTHPKRALLVISDGQDNNSRYTFSDLRRMLKESDVIIYAVGIEESGDGELPQEGRSILEEIAGVTGGKAFFPNNAAEMDDTFERIALELRTQYSIGFRPKNFANDGKWHRLKVKVQPPRGFPRLSVRGREGYFANAAPRNQVVNDKSERKGMP